MIAKKPTQGLFMAALLGLAGAPVLLGAVMLEQFAAGWPIELDGEETFYDIALTSEQYAAAGSLDKLAILDAAGEPMPFYRAEATVPEGTDLRFSLGVSPVYRALGPNAGSRLDVDLSERRARISVGSPDAEPGAEIAAFIVDAREIEPAVSAVELDWRPLDRPFLLGVRVEHSLDLTAWRPVGRGAIAALAIDGTRIAHGRIVIAPTEQGYYRITWGRGVDGFVLDGVDLIAEVDGEDTPPRVLLLSPVPPPPGSDEAGQLYFDAGGLLPTRSVSPIFPAANGWVHARIESSAAIEGPWRARVPQQYFYRLNFGEQELASNPVVLGRVEARFWRVVGEESVPGDLQLRLAYPAEALRFAARGQPPYMLVAGTVLDEVGPDRTLEAVLGQLDSDSVHIGAAELGPRRLLGGEAALTEPFRFPWRTVSLWTTLAVGVLIVAWMALRLIRELYGR